MLPVVPPNSEDVSPVVGNIAADRKVREVLDVASGKADGGKGHIVDSRHCRNKDVVVVMVPKRKLFVEMKPSVSMHGRIVM